MSEPIDLRSLSRTELDTLVVWRLDRLGRTALETLAFLDQLEAAGVRFVSLREGIDPSSPAGRLMRHIIAAFAEYEREVISERIRAGVRSAKAQGKRWGGKKKGQRWKLTPEKQRTIKTLLQAGEKKTTIARQLGLSPKTVGRYEQELRALPVAVPSARL